MKILIHSNAPWVSTGYGQQTATFVPRIAALGHEVAVSAFYGLNGAVLGWTDDRSGQTFRVYPGGFHGYGLDVLGEHAEHFFDGEPGIVIPLMDAWIIDPAAMSALQLHCWAPIDHEPAPPQVVAVLKGLGTRPIAMSRFGEQAMRAGGLDPYYVPHGIDTETFSPRDRDESRRLLDWPESAFVVGMVAANKGYPARKGFNEGIAAFARFQREHEDAMLYLHSEPHGRALGVRLPEILGAHGVPASAVRFAKPYNTGVVGFTHEQMARTFSALDVLINPAWGEGFGIPVIEAQACGTPVIATGWTAMRELAEVGWQVSGQPFFSDQNAFQMIPDVASLHQALESAYTHAGRLRARAREFALAYDADRVAEEHWRPVLADIEARLNAPRVIEVPEELRGIAGVAA